MTDAIRIKMLGLGLIFYITLYVIFLLYLLMNSSKQTKLVRKYGENRKNSVRRYLYIITVIGGIACIGFVYLFMRFV